MFRGHYDNREWYNKKDPLDKYFYKITSIYKKAKDERNKKSITNPLTYSRTKPDIQVRYESIN